MFHHQPKIITKSFDVNATSLFSLTCRFYGQSCAAGDQVWSYFLKESAVVWQSTACHCKVSRLLLDLAYYQCLCCLHCTSPVVLLSRWKHFHHVKIYKHLWPRCELPQSQSGVCCSSACKSGRWQNTSSLLWTDSNGVKRRIPPPEATEVQTQ